MLQKHAVGLDDDDDGLAAGVNMRACIVALNVTCGQIEKAPVTVSS